MRIYRYDGKLNKWERYILEDGGVAVGRATGNCRIYWNKGVAAK